MRVCVLYTLESYGNLSPNYRMVVQVGRQVDVCADYYVRDLLSGH